MAMSSLGSSASFAGLGRKSRNCQTKILLYNGISHCSSPGFPEAGKRASMQTSNGAEFEPLLSQLNRFASPRRRHCKSI